MIRTTVKRSNQQNNATNTENTREGYFSHFDIIGANLFRGFRIFREGNNNNSSLENNNNNNPLLPLPLSEFEGGLGGGFNPPLERNAGGLDSNVVVLVNALIRANLGINYTKRELN